MKLGLNNIDVILRLLKISYYVKAKDAIIEFVFKRYREFKKGFSRTRRLNLGRKKVKEISKIERKMAEIEKRLGKANVNQHEGDKIC